MPGRNADEAFRSFLGPLERSLRCLTLTERFVARRPGIRTVVTFPSGVPIGLSNGHVKSDFYFVMSLETVPHDDRQFRMSTRHYIYEVHEVSPEMGRQQIVRWHWHPESRSRVKTPHLHLPAGAPYSQSVHVPTGRITFEDVVRFLIEELGVRPAHDDWSDVLNEQRDLHVAHRTWHHDHDERRALPPPPPLTE